MANTFKIFVGGKAGRDAATDFTQNCVRAEYRKEFCETHTFDAYFDGVNKYDTEFDEDNNIFFCIYDGSDYWLLMKGGIEDVEWTSRKTVRITGKQSMRESSGSAGHMHQKRTRPWTQNIEDKIENLIGDDTWYDEAKAWLDDNSETPSGWRPN